MAKSISAGVTPLPGFASNALGSGAPLANRISNVGSKYIPRLDGVSQYFSLVETLIGDGEGSLTLQIRILQGDGEVTLVDGESESNRIHAVVEETAGSIASSPLNVSVNNGAAWVYGEVIEVEISGDLTGLELRTLFAAFDGTSCVKTQPFSITYVDQSQSLHFDLLGDISSYWLPSTETLSANLVTENQIGVWDGSESNYTSKSAGLTAYPGKNYLVRLKRSKESSGQIVVRVGQYDEKWPPTSLDNKGLDFVWSPDEETAVSTQTMSDDDRFIGTAELEVYEIENAIIFNGYSESSFESVKRANSEYWLGAINVASQEAITSNGNGVTLFPFKIQLGPTDVEYKTQTKWSNVVENGEIYSVLLRNRPDSEGSISIQLGNWLGKRNLGPGEVLREDITIEGDTVKDILLLQTPFIPSSTSTTSTPSVLHKIPVSNYLAQKFEDERSKKQMYIDDISEGILDHGETISDITVSGRVYDLTENEIVTVTVNNKEYVANVSGNSFQATVPRADLLDIEDGQYDVSAKTTVVAKTTVEIVNAIPPQITLTATSNYLTLAELTEGIILAQYSATGAENETLGFSLTGEQASYFQLSNGNILLTAAGSSAVNDESIAIKRLVISLNCEGNVKTSNKAIKIGISDPLTLVEATPDLPPQLVGNWELTFQDEFTADDIRDDHWVLKKGTAGMGYNSLDSVYVEDGKAVLMTQIDPKAHDCEYEHYAGCEITTFDKFAQQYGYFECRAKYEAKRGAWPAFWLMPDTGARGTVGKDAKVFLSFDLSSVNEQIESAELVYGVESSQKYESNVLQEVESYLQVYPSKPWSPSSLAYENIKQIPFRFLGDAYVLAGDVVRTDVTDYVHSTIGHESHFMIADNYRETATTLIGSSLHEDENLRPSLVINGSIVIPPYQEGSFRSGALPNSTPEVYTTGGTTHTIFDSWANASSTTGSGMEVDIFETLGVWGEEVNAIALHWDGYGSSHKGAGSGHIDITPSEDGYHTYGCLWDEDGLTFYIDNIQVWQRSFTPDEEVDNIRAFTDPAYILLSQQTGGWDGNNEQIDRDNFPARVWFDYVRVWKLV